MGGCVSLQVSCDSILNGCLDFTFRRATYVCELKHNLVKLEDAKDKLLAEKNDIRRKVRLAEQGGRMERLSKVEAWLRRVQDEENDVNELIKRGVPEKKNLCLGGFCSTSCISSHLLGRQVAEKLRVLTSLQVEGSDFKEVAERLPEDPVDRRPAEQEIVGRRKLFDTVWTCLMEKQVGIIGLTGMGGVGKTTLLEKINNTFCDNMNDFDVVIWVTVPKDLQREEKIQEKIAQKIGLYEEIWEKNSVEDKAIDILRILNKKKFVLFLDDLWDWIDLKRLGVPLPERNNATSNIIFTTRTEKLCARMRTDRSFKVECLTPLEARKLFESIVGDDTLNGHPDIPELAQGVVDKCDGLPLALKIVGAAMSAKKRCRDWIRAIDVLRRSAHDFPDMDSVFRCLKFSYDNLSQESIKSCFLYCSLFSEDYRIPERDLIDYWIGEGFLKNKGEAQDEGSDIVDSLLRSCLLEEDDDDHVKLHDVVRNMGLWIASKIEREKEKYFVCTGIGSTEALEMEKWEGAKRISVMENQIDNLSCAPKCCDLLTLFLNCNHLRIIGSGFFQYMPSLQVLNLSNNPHLTMLPHEISNLSSLEHLDLSKTSIHELPEELSALEKLQCLNLEDTSQLCTIPRELISKFSMLRVLRILNCGSRHATEGSLLSDDGFYLIMELLCLSQLEMLSIDLTTSEALKQFLYSHKLPRCTQFLCLKFLRSLKSLKVLVKDMGFLDTLRMLDCKHLEELRIDCSGDVQRVPLGFCSLQVVIISSCLKLKDLTWLVLASSLKCLVVSNCFEMEEIISLGKLGELPNASGNRLPFLVLECLELEQLPNLQSISQKVLPFPKLKEVKVDGCTKLKKLPLDSNSVKERRIVIQGPRSWWNELMWEDQATENAFHPFFKRL